MNKIIISLMIVMLLVAPMVAGAQDSLGTYKVDKTITLLQICGTCTYNNITSIVLPNATHLSIDTSMTKRGMEYTYDFSQTDLLGTYLVNGFGDLDGTANAWAYEFDVTSTGKVTPEGISTLLTGVFIIVFGVACVFLYLSSITLDLGPKLFFFISSLVFIVGSIGLAMVVIVDSNVSSAISGTLNAILFSLGMITFVIISYIMLKQWFSIIEIMRVKKGYSLGNVQAQTFPGYSNQRNWS